MCEKSVEFFKKWEETVGVGGYCEEVRDKYLF